jgi:hypothetical protein
MYLNLLLLSIVGYIKIDLVGGFDKYIYIIPIKKLTIKADIDIYFIDNYI